MNIQEFSPFLVLYVRRSSTDATTSLTTKRCAMEKLLPHVIGLQIYGGPGSLSHDFKIWPIAFQGSGPSGPILFS